MRSTTLKKALNGNIKALVAMTEQIQFGTISTVDLSAIKKLTEKANSHQNYLLACWHVFRPDNPDLKDVKAAKKLLKPLVTDGFALNLLSMLYSGEENDKLLRKAVNVGNPLAILNHAGTLSNVDDRLNYLSMIYNQLSPNYQKQLIDSMPRINDKDPESYYKFARFCQKTDLKTEMYAAMHNAAELDKKYIKKTVKLLNENQKTNTFFSRDIDANYVNNYIKKIIKSIHELDHHINGQSIFKLKEIEVDLKNIQFILLEKGGGFKSNQFSKLVQQLAETTEIFQLCQKKLETAENINNYHSLKL